MATRLFDEALAIPLASVSGDQLRSLRPLIAGVEIDASREEVVLIEGHCDRFGDQLRDAFPAQLFALEKRLADGPQAS